MSSLDLIAGKYLAPSPAGAYYFVNGIHQDPARKLLQLLFQEYSSPALEAESLSQAIGLPPDQLLALIYHMQKQALLQGLDSPWQAPDEPLEQVLPQWLPVLSSDHKALLADDQGFTLSAAGFTHEAAEELAALSASLAGLYDRHRPLVHNNLGCRASAWTLADAAGHSHLGFWPLHIGAQRFSLVIEGQPMLNQPAYTRLIWVLGIRYARQGAAPSTSLHEH